MPNPDEVFNQLDKYWEFINSKNDSQIEGQHFDRKQAGQIGDNGIVTTSSVNKLQDEIIECVSAFANNDGGLIIVGISKTGDVTGINHLQENQLQSITCINQLLRNQSSKTKYVDCINSFGKPDRILLIFVLVSEYGICETIKLPAQAWIRNGSICEPMTEQVREMMKREKRIVDFEKTFCCEFNPNEIDRDVLTQFRKSYENGVNYSGSDQDFLYQIGAIAKDKNGFYFTNAGYLFFATSPQRVLVGAQVRLMRFDVKVDQYKARGLPNFDRLFDGPLSQQIRKLRVHIKESGFFKIYQRRASEGGFVDEPELPPIAVDEAIVNAIAHRDYGIQIPIECILYTDGFVVENPGRIDQRGQPVPQHFDLSQITLDSMPRNSLLIHWLRMMRDENGKAYVQALSEGTKRMREEMARFELPSPIYDTNFKRTIVILLSNAEEREARFRAMTIAASSTEYANLFSVKLIKKDGTPESPSVFYKRLKELDQYLKDALEAKGWFIDRISFGQISTHRKGVGLSLPDNTKKYVQFFPAYILQFKILDGQLFLCLDYSLEVKNLSTIRVLLKSFTSQDLTGRHAIVNLNGWQHAQIVKATIETTEVHLDDSGQDEFIGSDKVIPDLSIAFIEKHLKAAGVSFDMYREIKRGSLALETNSSRLRAEKTISTIGELTTSVFPLSFNELTISLEKLPISLHRGNGLLNIQSLPEPVVEFNKHHETPDIRDGITKFGSYQTDQKVIEIIPICTTSMRELMSKLIERLKTGKYKYMGSERTFSTRLTYNTIITVESPEQIVNECKRLLGEHPDWIGNADLERLFLVHTPEQGYTLDDENSPYYAVKRFLLENGIPCQMVDTPTLVNPDWKDLNLALNVTAKCGLTPWVLPNSIPDADFFIGLSYTQSRSKGLRRLLGYATVFNEFGRWEFYSGNTDAFYYEERDRFFAQLTENTLTQIAQTRSLSDRPNIYFHYSAKFSKEDIANIARAARNVRPLGIYFFVSINSHHNIRLYDSRPETDGSMSRGSYIKTSPRQMIISTTGYNPYRKALGTPKPLEISVWVEPPKGEHIISPDIKAVANQILSLTKLNWASTDSLCGEPITTKYAGDIAYLTDAFLRQSGSFKLHQVLEKTPWFI
jgi:predicted HTH transcriptional regulator